MEQIVNFVALVIAGPMVGVEIAVAAVTNPNVDRLPDDAYRVARSAGSRMLGKVMPFWYVATLVALTAGAVVASSGVTIAAAVLMAAVVLLTVTMLVPINNRIAEWSDVEEVDRGLARRWDRLHWLRVVLLVAMFVLLAVGVVI